MNKPSDGQTQCQPGLGRVSLAAQRSGSLVRPGNYCCSSVRVASIDENKNKNSNQKITMTHIQNTYINRIALHAGKKGARPTEVGALASVFEKSATELKQQNLLKFKHSSVRIRDVALKTCQRRWTIGRSGEWGSGISVKVLEFHPQKNQSTQMQITFIKVINKSNILDGSFIHLYIYLVLLYISK